MATQLRPFLKSIADAIRNKKGTTETINAQDFASEIESIEGGGTGGATLKGGWTGTAVPVDTTTFVENIYFNTQLSSEEVANLVEQNIGFYPTYSEERIGLVFASETNTITILMASIDGIYIIASEDMSMVFFAYDSTGAGQDVSEIGFSGWNSAFNGTLAVNGTVFESAISSLSAVGNENLKSLFSITPFEKVNIPLSGTYEGKELTIIDNRPIDLTSNITNDKEIITYIKSEDYISGLNLIINTTTKLFADLSIPLTYSNVSNEQENINFTKALKKLDYRKCMSLLLACNDYLDNIKINNSKIMITDTIIGNPSFDQCFQQCRHLIKADINFVGATLKETFSYCYSLTTIILRECRNNEIPTYSNTLTNCYHFTGTHNSEYNPDGLKDGKIYVPDSYVDSFKTASGWSDYADLIYPLSEYVEQ